MSERNPRFEICRGEDGYWARYRAANGRVVWVTETYRSPRAAERAIGLLGLPNRRRGLLVWVQVVSGQTELAWIEVRHLDERP